MEKIKRSKKNRLLDLFFKKFLRKKSTFVTEKDLVYQYPYDSQMVFQGKFEITVKITEIEIKNNIICVHYHFLSGYLSSYPVDIREHTHRVIIKLVITQCLQHHLRVYLNLKYQIFPILLTTTDIYRNEITGSSLGSHYRANP